MQLRDAGRNVVRTVTNKTYKLKYAKTWPQNETYVLNAYTEILFPQTAMFLKRFTQTTQCRHWCFQWFTVQPYLTSIIMYSANSTNTKLQLVLQFLDLHLQQLAAKSVCIINYNGTVPEQTKHNIILYGFWRFCDCSCCKVSANINDFTYLLDTFKKMEVQTRKYNQPINAK